MTPQQMAALHAECFETPRPWSADEFRTLLTQPSSRIAKHSTGFAIAREIDDEAELLTIAVDPGSRKEGIGRQVLTDLTGQLSTAKALFLEVSSENTGAIAFYNRLGFSKVGTRKGYYRKPAGTRIDALIYSKAL